MAERSVFELLFEAIGTEKVKSQIGGMDSAVKSLDSAFGNLIKGMAAGIGAALTVGAIVDVSKAALDAADNIGKMAEKMGMSVENASVLNYTLAMSDVTTESLATSVKGLNKALEEAEKPGTAAANAFKSFNLNATDIQKLNTEDRLRTIADAFSKFEDGPNKSAAAIEIFGRAGLELIPLLNKGAAGFDEARARAEELGLVLSSDVTSAANAVNDGFTELGITFRTMWIKGMQDSLPLMSNLTGAFSFLISKTEFINGLFSTLGTLFKYVVSAGSYAVGIIQSIGMSLGAVAAVVTRFLSGDFAGASAINKQANKDLEDLWANIDTFNAKLYENTTAKQTNTSATNEGSKAKNNYGGASKKTKEEVDKETKSVDDLIAKMREELQTMDMSAAQKKQQHAINEAMKIQNVELRNQKIAEIQLLGTELQLSDLLKKAKEWNIQLEDQARQTRDGAVKSLDDNIAALEMEIRTLGMSATQKAVVMQMEKDMAAGVDTTTDAYMQRIATLGLLTQKSEDFKSQQKVAALEVGYFWEQTAKGMQSSFSTFFFDVMQGKTSSLTDSISQMISRIVAEMLAAQATMALFGSSMGGSGGSGGIFGSLFGGFRAGGGSVQAGVPYVVGEQRPELFVPKTDGYILPDANAAMGGGGSTNNITFEIKALDSQDVIRSMEKVKRQLVDIVNNTSRQYNLGGR